MSYAYVPVANARGETTLRPHLSLVLTHHSRSIETIGLLDTGADVNVLPYHVGLALGAIWADLTTSLQLSGNLAGEEARGLLLTATIGSFAPTRLVFAWTRAEHVPLILGQINFFI